MKSQFLLAIRVLKRRRFFTFISLFGIAFTIMALVVVVSMGEASLGDNPPFGNRDKFIIASHFRAEEVQPDTTYLIDSMMVAGAMQYDSTLEITMQTQSDNNSQLGYFLFDTYLTDIDGARQVSYAAPSSSYNIYLDGRKVELTANYTDAAYFEVLNFEFLAGQPYNATQVASGELYAVISDEAAIDYYGKADVSLIGEIIPIGEKDYKLVGIIKRPATIMLGAGSNLFMPISTAGPMFLDESEYRGSGMVIYEAESPASRDRIKRGLDAVAASLQALPDDPDKNKFHIEGLTYAEEIANNYYRGEGINRHEAYAKFFGPVSLLLLMLIILPAINLANVNLSRVFERAPEIAVRKSFGATDGDILRQFLFETFIITIIGSVIGVVLSTVIIYFANAHDWIRGVKLGFTPEVMLYTVLIILVFGLITGLAPAYRLAQTRIATSLR